MNSTNCQTRLKSSRRIVIYWSLRVFFLVIFTVLSPWLLHPLCLDFVWTWILTTQISLSKVERNIVIVQTEVVIFEDSGLYCTLLTYWWCLIRLNLLSGWRVEKLLTEFIPNTLVKILYSRFPFVDCLLDTFDGLRAKGEFMIGLLTTVRYFARQPLLIEQDLALVSLMLVQSLSAVSLFGYWTVHYNETLRLFRCRSELDVFDRSVFLADLGLIKGVEIRATFLKIMGICSILFHRHSLARLAKELILIAIPFLTVKVDVPVAIPLLVGSIRHCFAREHYTAQDLESLFHEARRF